MKFGVTILPGNLRNRVLLSKGRKSTFYYFSRNFIQYISSSASQIFCIFCMSRKWGTEYAQDEKVLRNYKNRKDYQ